MLAWVIAEALLVGIIAVAVARRMATRKGRSTGAWPFAAFFFAPSVLLLWVLPIIRNATVEAPEPDKAISCPSCGGTVSTLAPACPHCGHPQSRRSKPWFEHIACGVIAAGCVVFGVAAVQRQSFTTSGLPNCESSYAKENVTNVMGDMPAAKLFGLKVIDLRDIQTTENTEHAVRCTASALMNNLVTQGISFSFTHENGQMFVRVQFVGEPKS